MDPERDLVEGGVGASRGGIEIGESRWGGDKTRGGEEVGETEARPKPGDKVGDKTGLDPGFKEGFDLGFDPGLGIENVPDILGTGLITIGANGSETGVEVAINLRSNG